MSDVQRFTFADVDESGHAMRDRQAEYVKSDAYDAVAREVEGLKAKLKIWHDRDDDIMDTHGVDTDGYIKQLERQFAEAREQLAHTTCDHAVALAEAQQRIASLGQSLNAMDRINDRMMEAALRAEQAEARLAVDDQILEQIADALDGLPIAGEKVNPA